MVVRPKRLARYDDPAWLQQLSWLHCLGRHGATQPTMAAVTDWDVPSHNAIAYGDR
jgi:hypothetical protein